MRSLRYTNFLLTIIAVCLIYQCVKFGAPPSMAETGNAAQSITAADAKATPVRIVGTPVVKVEDTVKTDATIIGTPKVDVASLSGVGAGRVTFPVQVMNQSLPVEMDNQTGLSKPDRPLDVNIVGLQGDLPVRVTNPALPIEFGSVNQPLPVVIANNANNVIPVTIWGVPYPWRVEVSNFPKQ